jgi:outer membrane lipoprotein-sorting protein
MLFPRLPGTGFLPALILFTLSCQTMGAPVLPRPEPKVPPLFSLSQHLETRQSNFRDVKTFARTKISGQRLSQSFRQVLIVRGDDAIRIDTFNLFRQSLGVLISEGGQTFMYDPEKNRVIREAEVWNMMRLIMGSSIDFREYIRVFSGGIPRLTHLKPTAVRLNPDKTFYHLETIDTGTGERVDIKIDAYTLLPQTVTRMRGGRELYRVRWDDYRKVGPWDFAHRIIIELRNRGETVTVKYSDPVINQGLGPDVFHFAPALME